MKLKKLRQKGTYGILLILTISNILAWIAVYELSSFNFVEVNFFNVGQGDAIFITTSNFQQILIDGGPDKKILRKVASEMPFWDRTIDAVILTHPEEDHVSGLIEILKRYEVKYILWNGVSKEGARAEKWREMIKKEGGKEIIVKAGHEIVLGKNRSMEVLYPFKTLFGKEVENSNDSSVIIQLKAKENNFLFMGDVSKSIELKLFSKKINSEVLKVGHHGSKTSSDSEFLKKVSPQFAVISCGKDNRHGHPHKEVLENLIKYDIKVLRTDKNGDVKIISDYKNNLQVLTSNSRF